MVITNAGVFERRQKALLMLLDLIVIFASVAGVYYWRFGVWSESILSQVSFGVVVLCHLMALYIFGAYEIRPETRSLHLGLRLGLAILVTSIVAIVFSYLLYLERSGLLGRGVLFGSLVVYWVFGGLIRRVLIHLVRAQQKHSEWLFLVSDSLKDHLSRDLEHHRLEGRKTFITSSQLSSVAEELKKNWTAIVVALEPTHIQKNLPLVDHLMRARFRGGSVVDLVTLYEALWRKVPVFYLGAEWFVLAEGFSIFRSSIGLKVKRLLDLFMAVMILLITWPLLLGAWLLIKLEDGGPAFYFQTRTGKNGEPFTIVKLRSMRIDAEKAGAQWSQKNDDRITRVGRVIRKTRIDELPQLWNVLHGEMSFVGPRPERPEMISELEKQIPFYNLRHSVQPGLTGWAQVRFPYGSSVSDAQEKLQYDLYYIRNRTFLMDLKIILHTVRVVLFGGGR